MTSAAPGRPLASLTAEQEVTLRRIAFGESPARTLRAEDIGTLHKLGLIEESKDGPRLSLSGRRYFEALPKPVLQTSRSFKSMLGDLSKGMTKRGL